MDAPGERNPMPKGIPVNDVIARYLEAGNIHAESREDREIYS
jgi:hypothetical protein